MKKGSKSKRTPEEKRAEREYLKTVVFDLLDAVLYEPASIAAVLKHADGYVEKAWKYAGLLIYGIPNIGYAKEAYDAYRKVMPQYQKETLVYKDKEDAVNEALVIDIIKDPRFWQLLEKNGFKIQTGISYFQEYLDNIIENALGTPPPSATERSQQKGEEKNTKSGIPPEKLISHILQAISTEAAQDYFKAGMDQSFLMAVHELLYNSPVVQKHLESYGIQNPRDFIADARPLLNMISHSLRNAKEISAIYDILQRQDLSPEERDSAQLEMFDHIMGILFSPEVTSELTNIGIFISLHSDDIVCLIKHRLETSASFQEALKKHHISQEAVHDFMPIVLSIIKGACLDGNSLQPILKHVRCLIDPATTEDMRLEAMLSILRDVDGVVQSNPAIRTALQEMVPVFLDKHTQDFAEMAALWVKVNIDDKARNPDAPKLKPIIRDVTPVLCQLVKANVLNLSHLLKVVELYVQGDMQGCMESLLVLADRTGMVEEVGKCMKMLFNKPEHQAYFEGQILEQLSTSEKVLSALGIKPSSQDDKSPDHEAFKELAKAIAPVMLGVMRDLSHSIPTAKEVFRHYVSYTDPKKSPAEKSEAFNYLVDAIFDVLSKPEVSAALRDKLPNMVTSILHNIEHMPAIKERLEKAGFTVEAVRDFAPVLTSFIGLAFKDPLQYSEGIDAFKQLMASDISPEESSRAMITLLQNIQKLAEHHPDFQEMIRNALPEFMAKHPQIVADALVRYVPEKYKDYTPDILPTVQEMIRKNVKDMPTLLHIAEHYMGGRTNDMMREVISMVQHSPDLKKDIGVAIGNVMKNPAHSEAIDGMMKNALMDYLNRLYVGPLPEGQEKNYEAFSNDLLPVIREFMIGMAENPEQLVDVYSKYLDFANPSNSPEQSSQAFVSLLQEMQRFSKENTHFKELLEDKLPKLLGIHHQVINDVLMAYMPESYKQYAPDIMPLMQEMIRKNIKDMPALLEITEHYMAGKTNDMMRGIISLTERNPAMKVEMGQLIANVMNNPIHKEAIDSMIKNMLVRYPLILGIGPIEAGQEAGYEALAKDMLPFMRDLMLKIAEDPEHAVNVYHHYLDSVDESKSPEERDQAYRLMMQSALSIARSPAFLAILQQGLPTVLKEHKEFIMQRMADNPNMQALGMDRKFIESHYDHISRAIVEGLPVMENLIKGLEAHPKEVEALLVAQAAAKDDFMAAQEIHDLHMAILNPLKEIMKDPSIQIAIKQDLPKWIESQKSFFKASLPAWAKIQGYAGPPQLLNTIVDLVVPFAASFAGQAEDILSIAEDFVESGVDETGVRSMSVLEKFAKLMQSENMKPALKNMCEHIEKDKKSIGNILQEAFKNSTTFSKVNGHAVADILSHPDLVENGLKALEHYSRGNTFKAGFYGATMLANGAVRDVVGSLISVAGSKMFYSAVNFILGENILGDKLRDYFSGKSMDAFVKEHPEYAKEKRVPLSGYVDHLLNNKSFSSSFAGKMLQNVLQSHSFEELTLKDPMILKGLDIEGFSFKGSKLKKVSFQGSKIQHCNFEEVIIKDKIDLKDCVIDVESFQSLLPAIAAYNKEAAPDKKIDLKGVVIIGDISKLEIPKKYQKHVSMNDVRMEGTKIEELKVKNPTLDVAGIKPIKKQKLHEVSAEILGKITPGESQNDGKENVKDRANYVDKVKNTTSQTIHDSSNSRENPQGGGRQLH